LKAARFVFERLPTRVVLAAGAVGGRAAYLLVGDARRLALEHLELAFGPRPENRDIARLAFENVGRNLVEMLVFETFRGHLRERVAICGLEHLEAGLAQGKGVIAVAAHLGSWELLAAAVAERGYSPAVVGRRPRERALFEMLEELRRGYGVETIWRESPGAAKQILRALRQNRILALLIDQDTGRIPTVVVPFFGLPARTPSGAATLALRSGAALVCVFIHRTAGGHEIEFEPMIDPRSFPDEDPVARITAILSAAIERRVREHPEEWVWWHRRWRVPAPLLSRK
jgi:KDO2-lipid IV(A) lauroyltransferase